MTMTSAMTTATSSFHQPQHTQLLMHTRSPQNPSRLRRQLDIITPHSCQPPPPQNKSYFNPTTNETKYFEAEVKVNEIGILYDYEIRHASGVTWEDVAELANQEEEEKSGGLWGWKDKVSNFFGGDDKDGEDEEAVESSAEEEGGVLLKFEEIMAANLWDGILKDVNMTWVGDECAGLDIEDDTRRVLQRKRQGIVERKMEGDDDDEEEDDDEYDDDYEYEYEDDGVETEAETAVLTTQEGSMSIGYEVYVEETSYADKEDVVDSFTGTRLLGLTHLPLDYVNRDGCTIPDSTCTSIRGQLSIAYAGTNEYAVTQSIISRIQSGMDEGTFIHPDIPVLNLEFTGAGGTFAPTGSGGNGNVISLLTDRGTEPLETEQTEDPLSKYGVLFVCLVGVLGAGFVASMVVRYRKRKRRRMKEANEDDIEMRMEDYEANLALQVEEDATKTEGESSMADSPMAVAIPVDLPGAGVNQVVEEPESVMNQVELDVPPVDSGLDSNEIEISLAGSKSWK